MSQRRRRANDFTKSLNSFQYSENESDTFCSISRDSLDEGKSRDNSMSSDVIYNNEHSIILTGCTPNEFFMQFSPTSTSVLSEIRPLSDLNKRIDLFQVEPSCTKIDEYKENNNPQFNVKNEETKDGDTSQRSPGSSRKQILASQNKQNANLLNDKSRRDSNYNIHCNKSNVIANFEQSVPETTSTPQTNYWNSCINKDKQTCDRVSGDNCVNNEKKNFETVLHSLDNQLNHMKEDSHSQQILKRLSDQFLHAPKNFTEKLLTIIEESVINHDDATSDTSAINLSRLTTEFRKMCKFIEDESAPEWPVSPMATPPSQHQALKSPVCNKSIKVSKNENINSPTSTSISTTPISGIDILRKRFFYKICPNGSIDNVINESGNTSFERLEAQCKRLFPEEVENSKLAHRSLSMPSLLSMTQIQHKCEQQMASLNVSNSDENQKENKVSSTLHLLNTCLCRSSSKHQSELNCSKLGELHNNSRSVQYDNISYSKKFIKPTEKTDFSTIKPNNLKSNYTILNPDELERTLLQDIAEKRKRCLDTARLITEINADSEAIEAHKTLKMSPMFADDNEFDSLTHDESKFLKTLMSCKDYQAYLEKRKPLFKLLQNSNPCTPETNCKSINSEEIKCTEKEDLSVKKTPNARNVILSPIVKSCGTYRSPLSRKQGEEKKERAEGAKSKLFVTPGKAPPNNNCRQKKEYFPTMYSPIKNTPEKHILKSPNAAGLYRLNYNTILSPVGMYIRGTDTQLLKNVRPKMDELLLTPVKGNGKTSLNRNSGKVTPSKGITKTEGKRTPKFNLSPKDKNRTCGRGVKSPENDSTPKSHFILPKVSYELPLKVKTIKENASPKQGPRIKKLLEAVQSKVVIRHEARANSVRKEKSTVGSEIYEINYAPHNESIHIELAANKTNFIHGAKKM